MEIFLLYLSAFLRPIFFVDLSKGTGLQTTELFNWFSLALLGLLATAMFFNMSVRKRLKLTAVDLVAVAFSVWCTTGFLLYPENSHGRELVKLLFPLFTYAVARNILQTTEQYLKMLRLMILGFMIPVFWSAVLIALGLGVEGVNYWTQVARYEGVYSAAHNLAHNMTFLIMLTLTYVAVKYIKGAESLQNTMRRWEVVILITQGIAAAYCLAMSQVRTAIFGLIAFLGYYLYMYQRRQLFSLILPVSIVVVVVAGPFLFQALFYEVSKIEAGQWGAEEFGSGRPVIWRNNLQVFVDLPLDRQLAGLGVGHKVAAGRGEEVIGGEAIDSHNDYLDTLMETGVVGVLLYLTMQLLILRALLRLPGREKHALIGVFFAVTLMNFMSNSYITRSGMAQMYFLLMAYAEMRQSRVQSRAAPSLQTPADGSPLRN